MAHDMSIGCYIIIDFTVLPVSPIIAPCSAEYAATERMDRMNTAIRLGTILPILFALHSGCVAASMLEPGSIAPPFTLTAGTEDTIELQSFRGNHYVILVFYPGNETPGCTRQLCDLRDSYALLRQEQAMVFGCFAY